MQNEPAIPQQLLDQASLLVACQDEHATISCFECPKVLECDLRNAYIDAVYASMSQGNNTDFDF